MTILIARILIPIFFTRKPWKPLHPICRPFNKSVSSQIDPPFQIRIFLVIGLFIANHRRSQFASRIYTTFIGFLIGLTRDISRTLHPIISQQFGHYMTSELFPVGAIFQQDAINGEMGARRVPNSPTS